MNEGNLKSLMEDVLHLEKVHPVHGSDGTNLMMCCPYHGERNPSCGISVEKLVGACFSCKKTFHLLDLIMFVKKCSFKKAVQIMEDYGGQQEITKEDLFKSYDELLSERNKMGENNGYVLPLLKLAPYKSGKIYMPYLSDRGISKKTCRDFKIGWDEESSRITIPLFDKEGSNIFGFIRRAILPDKIDGEDNPEYREVYGNQPKYYIDPTIKKSKVLFPLDKFILPEDKSAILVEGTIDAIICHQNGFKNTFSIINSSFNKYQAEILKKLGVKRIIRMLDNDIHGEEGKPLIEKYCRKDFVIYDVVYPHDKNDPAELSRKQMQIMLKFKKKMQKRLHFLA
jgi:DNA primase